MRLLAVLLAADAAATDNRASLYALIGVVLAALLTAVGGIVTAELGRRRHRDAEDDAGPADVSVLSVAYADCRRDLEGMTGRIQLLEAEVEEARALSDWLFRQLREDDEAKEKAAKMKRRRANDR